MNQFQAPYSQGDWWGAAATLGAGEGRRLRRRGEPPHAVAGGLRAPCGRVLRDLADRLRQGRVQAAVEGGRDRRRRRVSRGGPQHRRQRPDLLLSRQHLRRRADQHLQGDERARPGRRGPRARRAQPGGPETGERGPPARRQGEGAQGGKTTRRPRTAARTQSDINQTYRDATKPGSEIGQRIAAVRGLGKYRDLRNPFTDWLHGAFRLATGEPNRASDLLRNAVVLDGERNRYVRDDFRVAEEAAAGVSGGIPRRVWIVHEDGIGPRLDEFRYDLPVFAPSGFIYSGIALPEFVTGTSRRRLALRRGRRRVVPHRAAARRRPLRGDRVRGRLRRHRRQGDRLRGGEGGRPDRRAAGGRADGRPDLRPASCRSARPRSLMATTQADTRMWRALPKSINVASLPWPEDGRVRISAGTGFEIADIALPDAPFVLITVKTVSAGAPAAVHVAALSGAGVATTASGDHGGKACGGARSGSGRAPDSSGGDDLGPGSRARSRSQ